MKEDENYLGCIEVFEDDSLRGASRFDCKLKQQCIDPLVAKLNELTIDNENDKLSWNIFETVRGEVKNAPKIYWKCTNDNCNGRAISNGLEPPLKLTQSHKNHEPEPAILEKLECIQSIKKHSQDSNEYPRCIIRKIQSNLSNECVSMLKKDAIRKIFVRERNKNALSGFNAKSLEKLVIPDNLQITFKNKKFYFFDSGQHDKNRIIIFTTEENLRLMINACYFHLCQSVWRRIQTTGLVKSWFDENFRLSFRRLQALAFIPEADISKALDIIRKNSPNDFLSILNYFENNFIGSKEKSPRYHPNLWNLFERVKNDMTLTKNDVESWHSRLKYDSIQNLTVAKVVELFRLEQSYMETTLINLFNGEQVKKLKKRQLEKNEKIKPIQFIRDTNKPEMFRLFDLHISSDGQPFLCIKPVWPRFQPKNPPRFSDNISNYKE
ncbi:unnamed protein product [Brachionus calyciflorus]|uniref:FLYWCH-type domain-containing protein n=1 Tax=Brachionus calyciflorus TaxID=104777 RepID=A0A814LGL9_9BILA|nr:unnamed protein product [Brachionus calyciflorus]